jgi:hypoxanthine phosphoribosyltransferase
MKRVISQKMIQTKVKALAKQIRTDYSDRVPIFIGILKGSFMFMADLIREYKDECELDFMAVASYGNYRTGAGIIRLIKDISVNIKKRDVLIVEDIIDTGLTSNYIRQYLELRNPRSIEFVTLLDKRGARRIDIKIKYIGFRIPNKFVIGYGLDYAEKYRQLPYIAEHEDKERKK